MAYTVPDTDLRFARLENGDVLVSLVEVLQAGDSDAPTLDAPETLPPAEEVVQPAGPAVAAPAEPTAREVLPSGTARGVSVTVPAADWVLAVTAVSAFGHEPPADAGAPGVVDRARDLVAAVHRGEEVPVVRAERAADASEEEPPQPQPSGDLVVGAVLAFARTLVCGDQGHATDSAVAAAQLSTRLGDWARNQGIEFDAQRAEQVARRLAMNA